SSFSFAMAAGTLYTYPENFRAAKILIAAKYSGANVKVVSEPPAFKLGETNKSDDFLKKFPLGKVPAFETNDGQPIFESNAIAYYVANDALRGNSTLDATLVQQWVNFADSEILPASCTWVFPCLGIMQYNKQNTERAKQDIGHALNALNSTLKTRTFLVGERISLADIACATSLVTLYKMVLDPEFRKPYQNVNRWFLTCVNQPEFKAVLGDVTPATTMAQFDAAKFAELNPKKDGGKKEKKEKPKQEKQEKKPKQEKPKEAEPEEPPMAKEPKDPFAGLPGNMDMDSFKRCYSNEDTLTKAIPLFWDLFEKNKEDYSIWYCEYMFPEELELIFMTCNLVGGMFQRLDKLHKYAFGSMCIFGEDRKNSISGVWFWKGQGLAFDLSENFQIDSPSYKWTKLDPDSEDCKLKVKEYFSWEGDFAHVGKKFNQGKIFK
ncbi:unnamed protein product, partial [Owenia fusiformis]